MDISRENYEQYFLDYAEGRLSPEMEKSLMDFLIANPDLKDLLDNYDAAAITSDDPVIFRHKEKLRKNTRPTARISSDNVEEWMITSLEDLLTKEDDEELEEFLYMNPAYRYDLDKFQKTRLDPDLAVIFPNKDQLKKKRAIIPLNWLVWSAPAAAAVILLFMAIRFFDKAPIEEPVMLPGMESLATGRESQIDQIPSQPADEVNPGEGWEEKTYSTGTPSPIRENSFRLNAKLTASVVVASSICPPNYQPEENESLKLFAFTPNEPSLFARVFRNYFGQAGRQVRGNAVLAENQKPKLNFWSLAQAGVKGYNSITDRDLELLVGKNQDGKATYYALLERDEVILMKELDRD